MPIVQAAGETLHYREHRDGPRPACAPLVLVHGAGGDLGLWPGEVRRLPGATVYALDLPGHGGSGGAGHAEIGAYAEAVRGFVEALGMPPAIVAGQSMGGAIALELALRYPGRVAGLALIASGAALPVDPLLLEALAADHVAASEELARRMHGDAADPNLVRLSGRRLRDVSPQVVYGDLVACNAFDRRADLVSVRAPALVLCGDADQMTPPAFSRELQAGIAGSELVVIERAGHLVAAERSRAVAVALAAFVKRVNGHSVTSR